MTQRCPRCGGTYITNYGETECLSCGRPRAEAAEPHDRWALEFHGGFQPALFGNTTDYMSRKEVGVGN